MSTTEQVYALLVEANPVRDPDELILGPESAPRLQVIEPGGPSMDTKEAIRTVTPEPPRRRALLAGLVAAAVVTVAIVGAVLLVRDSGQPAPPVITNPPAPTTVTTVDEAEARANAEAEAAEVRATAAVRKVEEIYAALNAGDADLVAALTAPNDPIAESDRHLWEFNAAFAATYPQELKGCEATSTANTLFVRVECSIVNHDPVFVANGVSDLIAPWQVFDDGAIKWRPYEGADIVVAARDYGVYLRERHETDYLEVCQPASYDLGTVVFNGNIALTGSCAALAVPLAEDIAEWVAAGRPES